MSEEVLFVYAITCWLLMKFKIIKKNKKNIIIMVIFYIFLTLCQLMISRYYSYYDLTDTSTVQTKRIILTSPVGSYIKHFYVKSNQRVEKGDPIYSFENDYIQYQKDQYMASYNAQMMVYNEKMLTLQKMTRLQGKVYTENQVKDQKFAAEAQKNVALYYKSKANNSQWFLDHTVIRAPQSGYMNILYAAEGQYFKQARNSPILLFTDQKYLAVRIPNQVYTFIKVGAFAEFFVDAYPGRIFRARVQSVTQYTGEARGTMSPTIKSASKVSAHMRRNHKGGYGRLVILTFKEPKGVVIPMGAVGACWISAEKPTRLFDFFDMLMGFLLRVQSIESYFYAMA